MHRKSQFWPLLYQIAAIIIQQRVIANIFSCTNTVLPRLVRRRTI